MNGTSRLGVDVDLSNERMQKKIRNAQTEDPYILVVGNRETAEGTVAVRLRSSGKNLGATPLKAFLDPVKDEAESRRHRAD
jgi:threonyl-tRNA synthetase